MLATTAWSECACCCWCCVVRKEKKKMKMKPNEAIVLLFAANTGEESERKKQPLWCPWLYGVNVSVLLKRLILGDQPTPPIPAHPCWQSKLKKANLLYVAWSSPYSILQAQLPTHCWAKLQGRQFNAEGFGGKQDPWSWSQVGCTFIVWRVGYREDNVAPEFPSPVKQPWVLQSWTCLCMSC